MPPSDRNSIFEAVILPKVETRFTVFDDKIISMYANGMTTRGIQWQLQKIYGIDVSTALISQVTDGASAEILLQQNRPLYKVYRTVYLDHARSFRHVNF